ncbi:MAG: nucleoside deaminase [Verrucomicrobiota bacterium]|nr:nucleoside deaminase [Verrucomicrobiota bacterium]
MKFESWMREALHEARVGLESGEPPFGCVIVDPSGEILVRNHDRVIQHGDMSSHAETLAVREAIGSVETDNLTDYQLISTIEPCAMCFTTAWLNRISRIVFGATMEDVYQITQQKQREMTITASEMNHRSGNTIELVGGVLANDCKNIFKHYQFPE